MVRLVTILGLMLGVGTTQETGPLIRTSTRLVQISVIVHDKNGAVANLTKDDFILTEKGKPRAIDVFSVEGTEAGIAPQGQKPRAVNTFSNRAQSVNTPRGVTIILLDSLNTLFHRMGRLELAPSNFDNGALVFAKQAALKFARDLDPNDRVAAYSLGRSLKVLCDFTGDRAELLKVLEGYRDSSLTIVEDQPDGSEVPHINRAQTTIAALMAIASHVADIPGRKNLVWLTEELPFSGAVAARVLHDKNIAVYPVDARGLSASFDPHYASKGLDALRDLAELTGGRAFYNNNDLSGAIHEAVKDASVTYTLGFYPEEASLDGQFHELKVQAKRPNLDVRYPRGYFAFKEAPLSEKKTGFIRAVESPLEASAIGLEARVERAKPPAPTSFLISCSIDIAHLALEEVGDLRKGVVEIYTAQQDQSGALLQKTRQKLILSLTRDQYLAYLKSGVPFSRQLAPMAGFNTLRLIVGDPRTGATGTLIIPASQIH
jgi:VWFA-related protein